MAAALLLSSLPTAAQVGHRKGDHILFSGQVTGSDDLPVGNVTVLLELSRTRFNVRKFKEVKTNTLRIPVTATVDGRYLHDWRWDGYYNTFELAVALPRSTFEDAADSASSADGEFEILYRIDISKRVRQSKPLAGQEHAALVTPLLVEGGSDLGWLRRLIDGSAGEEERRVYRELGRPDRVDSYEADGAAWWYFEAGKVYRFRDGALEQVEHFEPIRPL